MKNTCIALLLVLLASLNACIDPIDTGTEDIVPKLVVDGQITNLPGPYTVKLGQSEPYDNASLTRPVANATVFIMDDEGSRFDLTETSRGTYRTDSVSFQGMPGRTYTLHILTENGKEYQSQPQFLQASPPVDTIFSRFVEEVSAEGIARDYFEVYLKTRDTPGERNFYRWKWAHYESLKYCKQTYAPDTENGINYRLYSFCCEPCWKISKCNNCIDLANDQFTDGRTIERLITTIPYDSKDDYFMIIEQHALQERAYRFWNSVVGQTNNTGGIFDNPPASIPGNIANINDAEEQVLGLFTAIGVTRKSVYIKRDYVLKPPPQDNSGIGVQILLSPVCEPCQEGIVRTAIRPPGW
ncbi:MAG: DUF4249 domain-containing protein [Saprospiraceae bacterium]|nr:DUF4249 domain-containing protein [Saprospiraceae bacterium]